LAQSVFQGGGTPEAIPGKMPADLTLASDD